MNTEEQSEQSKTQTITKTPEASTSEHGEHIKNPKRVAQGKRLAEQSRISKQKAKEKHYETPLKQKKEEKVYLDQTPSLTTVLAILGTAACLASTFFTYKQWMEPKQPEKVVKVKEVEKVKTNYKNLDKLGL